MDLKMKNYIKTTLTLALSAVALTGCNDFLDTMPDNRAQLTDEQKIQNILTSAYPDHECCWATEVSCDNSDNYGERVPNSDRWLQAMFEWRPETEKPDESLDSYWATCYSGIAATNEALVAIEKLPQTESLLMAKGEALVCRAYLHFQLATLFCQAWTKNADKELGLPYMTEPEVQLDPKYDRGNLADFYKKIEADLEEGLKTIGDSYYKVPKYHFNKKAALAFACRFYCYTEQWEKAVKYADMCLGQDPRAVLRDYKKMASMTQKQDVVALEYVNPSASCNLLLHTGYSNAGLTYGAYTSNGRYMHGQAVAGTETILADQIFGNAKTAFHTSPKIYQGSTYNKVIFWKAPYLFEYTDLNAGIGYRHSVFAVLTTDECLLNRAEARIMLKQYDAASQDLTAWMQNITKSKLELNPDTIQKFYNKVAYSYEEGSVTSTVKKHLNPGFAIDAEGSVQETMLQCMLTFRRIETLTYGMRWFDVKRYGIEIPRRLLNADGEPESKTDWLAKDDVRRAFQLPATVLSAGLKPNPRPASEGK